MNRPHRATGKGDANHFIVRDFLKYRCGGFTTAPKEIRGSVVGYTAYYHGHVITAIDLSKYGGLLPDWLVSIDGQTVLVEVKTPDAYQKENNNLTPGENWTDENIGLAIVSTDEQVENLMIRLTAQARKG